MNTFLLEEFEYFASFASLTTRNEYFPIYNPKTNDLQKARELKKDLYIFLRTNYYKNYPKTEKDHINIIVNLSNYLSKKYGSCLHKKMFRIGISQKAINLYCKYLWTANLKPNIPYHCPIDNIIKNVLLKKNKGQSLKDWTELVHIKDYLKYIDLLKIEAKSTKCTIAEWELNNWKRRK